MSIFKCKMCGGTLEITNNESVAVCEYCGTKQTLPTVKDEGLQTLFNRANVLRMKSEFDKAADVYEKILQKSEKEAEAYWGLILCKYGVEYVEDPKTFKRVPTCHRASYDAVATDEDYLNALKYADPIQRGVYQSEAAAIDEIQKGIIAVAQKEDPYDVFICYKETDEFGKRTQDSVIANDIYYQLTQEGFKVFYAAITLEDKLGTEYEPYIFSALNTSKVMLALGTKPEYFSAVWVKNEWSRFLKIMKNDRNKMLIPCYRDMDAYELPEEFAHLQAQDMSKIGFINDVVRGIKKIVNKESSKVTTNTTVVTQASGTTTNAQLQRGYLALEDKEWDKANGFFEEALNIDPQCSEAYIGQFLVEKKCESFDYYLNFVKQSVIGKNPDVEILEACPENADHINKIVSEKAIHGYLEEITIVKLYDFDRTYKSNLKYFSHYIPVEQGWRDLVVDQKLLMRARQFETEKTKKQLDNAVSEINSFIDEQINKAKNDDEKSIAKIKSAYDVHIAEVDKQIEQLYLAAYKRREETYERAVETMNKGDIPSCERAIELFDFLGDYKESKALIKKCNEKIELIKNNKTKILKLIAGLVALMVVISACLYYVVIPHCKV